MSSRSHRPLPVLFAIALGAFALSQRASGQAYASVDVGSRSQRVAEPGWSQLVSLAPALRFEGGLASLFASGSFASTGSTSWLDAGRVDGALFSRARGGFRVSAIGSAERTEMLRDSTTTRFSLGGRLSYRNGSGGVWTGGDLGRDSWRQGTIGSPRLTVGGWRQIGSATFTLAVGRGTARSAGGTRTITRPHIRVDTTDTGPIVTGIEDTVEVQDPGERFDWGEGEAGLHWSRGRLTLDGVFGLRLPNKQREQTAWGSAEMAFALSTRAAIVGGFGVRAAELAYSMPSATYVTLGIRLSPTGLVRRRLGVPVRPIPTAFDLRLTGQDVYVVRVRVPQARTVELSADFTEWKSVALRNTVGDTWEATLRIAPGTHRLNIRVDGDAWVAPPGTNTVVDDFSGTVGIVVVPGERR